MHSGMRGDQEEVIDSCRAQANAVVKKEEEDYVPVDKTAMFQVALISDNRHLVDGMSRFSMAPVTWLRSTVELVMSSELGAWPEPPYVLWIDVPCAAVTQSVKLTKLREVLTQAVQKACEQSCPVILRKREFDGAEKLVEH